MKNTLINAWKMATERMKFLTSPKFIISVIIILFSIILWIAIKKIYKKVLSKTNLSADKKTKVEALSHTILGIVKTVIFVLTLLLVLGINGINVAGLVTSLGVASAVVGLALQDYLKDIIMGIHIMTDDFFDVGDVVHYGDTYGRVEEFNLKSTKIRDIYTLNLMTICNRNISEISKVGTLNSIRVPLPYDLPTEKANAVLAEASEALKKEKGINDAVYKGLQEFEDSALVYLIVYFCRPEKRPEMYRTAIRVVKAHLDQAGIEIPFNQLDIHQK